MANWSPSVVGRNIGIGGIGRRLPSQFERSANQIRSNVDQGANALASSVAMGSRSIRNRIATAGQEAKMRGIGAMADYEAAANKANTWAGSLENNPIGRNRWFKD